jgi:hypothetical protein
MNIQPRPSLHNTTKQPWPQHCTMAWPKMMIHGLDIVSCWMDVSFPTLFSLLDDHTCPHMNLSTHIEWDWCQHVTNTLHNQSRHSPRIISNERWPLLELLGSGRDICHTWWPCLATFAPEHIQWMGLMPITTPTPFDNQSIHSPRIISNKRMPLLELLGSGRDICPTWWPCLATFAPEHTHWMGLMPTHHQHHWITNPYTHPGSLATRDGHFWSYGGFGRQNACFGWQWCAMCLIFLWWKGPQSRHGCVFH